MIKCVALRSVQNTKLFKTYTSLATVPVWAVCVRGDRAKKTVLTLMWANKGMILSVIKR